MDYIFLNYPKLTNTFFMPQIFLMFLVQWVLGMIVHIVMLLKKA